MIHHPGIDGWDQFSGIAICSIKSVFINVDFPVEIIRVELFLITEIVFENIRAFSLLKKQYIRKVPEEFEEQFGIFIKLKPEGSFESVLMNSEDPAADESGEKIDAVSSCP